MEEWVNLYVYGWYGRGLSNVFFYDNMLCGKRRRTFKGFREMVLSCSLSLSLGEVGRLHSCFEKI
jgi:hypothetical protein